MASISKEKEQLRSALLRRRGSISSEYRKIATRKINLLLLRIALNYNAIATFCPFGSEIDISLCNRLLLLAGKRVMLPKVIGDTMGFVDIAPADMERYCRAHPLLYQPRGCISRLVMSPDLIIVPGLGYDLANHRIGYGKGFYDKNLILYQDSLKIMPAFSIQREDFIPYEEHDIKVDFVINENLY